MLMPSPTTSQWTATSASKRDHVKWNRAQIAITCSAAMMPAAIQLSFVSEYVELYSTSEVDAESEEPRVISRFSFQTPA